MPWCLDVMGAASWRPWAVVRGMVARKEHVTVLNKSQSEARHLRHASAAMPHMQNRPQPRRDQEKRDK